MRNLSELSIQYVKGVGPARAKLFANLGVESVEDLFYVFPRRYEDRRHITSLAQVRVGEWQTITGTVQSHAARKSYYTKKHLTEISLDDGTGRLFAVWFNQPYLNAYFKPGKKVVCYGKVDVYKNRLQMISPEYEILEEKDDEMLNLKRIVPIYPLTKGMSQRYIRKLMHHCLEHYASDVQDDLPVSLRNKCRLANIKRSIRHIHFPENMEEQEEAVRRISFEEFYYFQIAIMQRRLNLLQMPGIKHHISDAFSLKFLNQLPFECTQSQKRVMHDVIQDMRKSQPMLRLLQGDVGSGKTVVALFGCAAAIENGHQAAFMAPTEILARQHYENIEKYFGKGKGLKSKREKDSATKEFLNPHPFNRSTLKVVLLTSSTPAKERGMILKQIKNGEVDLVIGTHSLLGQDVIFRSLSFVVIDEQHKFGVRQRALLTEKGVYPDVLIMTATPIPRTLCITLYGDLDVSVIKELPLNRGKIKTKLFPPDAEQLVYNEVKEAVRQGRQAYIVYPIIEESEQLDLKAAQESFKQLKKGVFKKIRLALIHGRLKTKEAQEIMQDFKEHKIDVLIATTVLEVGIDIPNATVMVIEHAERFGLAQLHQLRGRIGRGEHASQCFLIGHPQTEEGKKRLQAIVETTDGFKIAQADLEIRGPGQFFGRHQHGLQELRMVNPLTQMDILEEARKEALLLAKEDPALTKHIKTREIISRRYPTYLQSVSAG